MNQDIKIKTDNYNFKFRVSGIVIVENKLLITDMDNSGFFCLPGGYVELGETTVEAIIREMKEEINKNFEVKEYLGVVEIYFINKYTKKMHEISFYYLMHPKDFIDTNDFIIYEKDGEGIIKQDFKWIDLNEIDNYDIRPEFLKERLRKNDMVFNHLIINQIDKL